MPSIIDNRSGEKKFIVGARSKQRNLDVLESTADKLLEEKLWQAVKAGKRFVQQEQKILEHKQHQRPPVEKQAKRKKKKKKK
jgi:hypothetical protein